LFPDGARLLIGASGAIARIPFAALPIDDNGIAVPLLMRHEVSYLPSLMLFERRRPAGNTAIDRRVLAIADAAGAAARARLLAPLPATRAEVQFVAGVMNDSRVMIAGDATEHAIKTAAAEGYPVLHLATHALLDPSVPERSAILLGATADEDGLLQSREIYQLPLRGSLIVLSGCRTADGHLTGADGLRSLARAFLQAGGRTVVGSLWDLPDRQAASMVQTFYANLNGERTVGAALRASQIAMAGRDPYADSRAWAAMVMLGDPSTMLAERRGWNVGWAPMVTLILMAGWIAVWRRPARTI
jgi:CHAT domain-containing protein